MTDGIEVLITTGRYSDFAIVGLFRVPSREWFEAHWANHVNKGEADPRLPHLGRFCGNVQEFVKSIEAAGAVRIQQTEAHLPMWEDEGGIKWREAFEHTGDSW